MNAGYCELYLMYLAYQIFVYIAIFVRCIILIRVFHPVHVFNVIAPLWCWLQIPKYVLRVLGILAASPSSFCQALLLCAAFFSVRSTSCTPAGSAPLFPFHFHIRSMVSP